MNPIRHLVMFSGGVCSWAAAKRVVERHGKEGVVLLFADTKMEDEDLYRFLDEAALNVGVPLIKIADGRTPWGVMQDMKFIASSRVDPCSRILKRELLNKWRTDHCDPAITTTHFGLSWDEAERSERLLKRHLPWKCGSPMVDRPWVSKQMMFDWLKREGIEAPRLYALGFPHNNCGGFCVKAGQAHFALLLRTMPERYAFHEAQEEAMRAKVGDHSIMNDRAGGGPRRPLSMKEFRERIEARQTHDEFDWGGCGCAVE
jgi:hypothetical protein